MKAMELCRAFWQTVAEPAMQRDFPDLYNVTAAGLVGNGSECFGFDDSVSRDHDWGTDLCLWLPADRADRATELQEWKQALLAAHPEYPARTRSVHGADLAVTTADTFYTQLIGCPHGPQTVQQWMTVPEEQLALAVNGAVFYDPVGTFTAVRQTLLAHYPEQVRRKKIAARCMMLAQTGQYNLDRCRKRGHTVTGAITRMRFVEEAIHLVFLLNRVYCPYYKWAFPAMEQLPLLAAQASPLLRRIAVQDDQTAIDTLCGLFADTLRSEGLSDCGDWFLAFHGEAVQRTITDPLLRALPPQFG